MAFERYEPERRLSKVDMGHKESCAFVDNHGPACNCDKIDHSPEGKVAAKNLADMMMRMGWKCDPRSPRGYSFERSYGPHWIGVHMIISGWKFQWARGPMVIFDSPSFGTIGHALDALWEMIAVRWDEYHQIVLDNMELRSNVIMVDSDVGQSIANAKKAWKENLPANKDWRCPACGVNWTVPYEQKEPVCIRCNPSSGE